MSERRDEYGLLRIGPQGRGVVKFIQEGIAARRNPVSANSNGVSGIDQGVAMKTTTEALNAYDELYKSPVTGRHIIDTEEAQVAADLAAALKAEQARNARLQYEMAHPEPERVTKFVVTNSAPSDRVIAGIAGPFEHLYEAEAWIADNPSDDLRIREVTP